MADTPVAGPQSANGNGNGRDMAAARSKRARRFRIFGAVVAVAALAGVAYWWSTHNEETTDDAFIDANVSTISSRVDGHVVAVDFVANQWVDKGQVLVELDPTDYKVAVDTARAALAVAEAQEKAAEADLAMTKVTATAGVAQARDSLAQAQHQVAVVRQQAEASQADAIRAASDIKRYTDLVKTSDASRQRYDQALADARSTEARFRGSLSSVTAAQSQVAVAQAQLDDANAAPQRIDVKAAQVAVAAGQVEQAQAALRQAELNLSYTKVVAPVSGRLTKRAVEPGDVIQRGQALTELVADPPWVTANFKETQLARMRVGQPVSIHVDALPDLQLMGHVASIQPGSGSRFTLLPPENATGNYVKVVQRVPVKILFDHLDTATMHRFGPGMSVEPTVDVGAPGTEATTGK